MALFDAIEVLICPVCLRQTGNSTSRLHIIENREISCSKHHVFDIAKQGYLNLLSSAAPRNADTVEMVMARERIQNAGIFFDLSQKIAELFSVYQPHNILEAGCGTGYYLGQVLNSLTQVFSNPKDQITSAKNPYGLGIDISVPALKRAAKAHPKVAAITADVWQRLPVLEHSFAAILGVFAPRNFAEFSRVLEKDGILVLALPTANHLANLRQALKLLDISEAKTARVIAQAKRYGFYLEKRILVKKDLVLDLEAQLDLVLMGPNAFHLSVATARKQLSKSNIETIPISIEILCFSKTPVV